MTSEKNERQFSAEGNESGRKPNFNRRPNRRRRPNNQTNHNGNSTATIHSQASTQGANADHPTNPAGRSTRQAGHLPPRNHRPAKPVTNDSTANDHKAMTADQAVGRFHVNERAERQDRMERTEQRRPKKPAFKAEESLEDIQREAIRIEKEIFLEIATISAIGLD